VGGGGGGGAKGGGGCWLWLFLWGWGGVFLCGWWWVKRGGGVGGGGGGGGGVEMPQVVSCYRNRDKLQSDGPLCLDADLTWCPTLCGRKKRRVARIESEWSLVCTSANDIMCS